MAAGVFEENPPLEPWFRRRAGDGYYMASLAHSLGAALALALDAARRGGFAYDAFLSCRPDVLLWRDVDLAALRGERLYRDAYVRHPFGSTEFFGTASTAVAEALVAKIDGHTIDDLARAGVADRAHVVFSRWLLAEFGPERLAYLDLVGTGVDFEVLRKLQVSPPGGDLETIT